MAKKLNIKSLADKYKNFNDPNAKVLVSGEEIKVTDDIFLEVVEVTSCIGDDPNMAVLSYCVNNLKKDTVSTMEGYLNAGAKVEVKVGYEEELNTIFLGYLHEIKVASCKGDIVEYTLVCLDVKGLMKKISSFQISGKKKAQEMLNEILDAKEYKSLIKKQSVDTIPTDFNQDYVIKGETHYDWLCSLAQYLNYEFFCDRGELHFHSALKDKTEVLELDHIYGLKQVSSTVSMAGQFGSVQVVGYNRKDEKVSGSSQWEKASGSFTGELESALKECERVFLDRELETVQQAQKRAAAIMQHISRQCSRMKAENIGIPELCPGICVKITKDDITSLSGTIYVEEAVHRLDKNGYRTVIEGTRTA